MITIRISMRTRTCRTSCWWRGNATWQPSHVVANTAWRRTRTIPSTKNNLTIGAVEMMMTRTDTLCPVLRYSSVPLSCGYKCRYENWKTRIKKEFPDMGWTSNLRYRVLTVTFFIEDTRQFLLFGIWKCRLVLLPVSINISLCEPPLGNP